MLQKQLGQFYTDKNIFKNPAFLNWYNSIPIAYKENILEPFAGSNGIIKMLKNLDLIQSSTSFDIMPRDSEVSFRDTLLDFPKDFNVVITNPPFLAKNSATRHNLKFDYEDYNDLYEYCLKICLNNTDYVAAIIPESFITNSNFDKSRLHTFISLQEKKIFKDTEHPVCLALFNPEPQYDFKVFNNKIFIGNFLALKQKEANILSFDRKHNFTILWHHPEGQIGLEVLDATNRDKKITFLEGDLISSTEVNLYSRLRTRIMIIDHNGKPLNIKKVNRCIRELNKFLKYYRKETHDVFLTAFKGLRDDGKYRRRLDFTKARQIVDASLSQI